jgi:hypothetical protein
MFCMVRSIVEDQLMARSIEEFFNLHDDKLKISNNFCMIGRLRDM